MLARVVRKELVDLQKRAVLLHAPQLLQRQTFATDTAPRRLRRLKPVRSRWDNEFKMPDTGGLREAFTPDEDNFDDYLRKVSLSPWVPTPDPVARRVLDLLHAGPDDVSLCIMWRNPCMFPSFCTDLFLWNTRLLGSCRSWLG